MVDLVKLDQLAQALRWFANPDMANLVELAKLEVVRLRRENLELQAMLEGRGLGED